MSFELHLIHHGLIDIFWPEVEAFVSAACARSNGRYEAHHVHEYARLGQWQIWQVTDRSRETVFVLGTQIITYPTGIKSLDIRFGTGQGREDWLHLFDQVLAWGKAQGCTLKEGVMRKGWRRVLKGFDHTHEFLEGTL